MSDIENPTTIPDEIIAELNAAEERTAGLGPEQFTVPSTPTNDFLQIASGGGAIVESQAEWAGEGGILNNGFPTGIVLQEQYNKAWRQATSFIRVLGWHASQLIQQPALDDGTSEKLWRQLYEAFLVQHVVFDATGTNSYTTPNTFGLTWTAPPRAGTEISLWVTNANTSTTCTLNFVGTGIFPIKHLDGSNPRVGDLAGHVKLSYSGSVWYIDCITMNMLNLRIGDLIAITSATTVYVSTTGSNTTGNGTIGSPWQTVQYAFNRITSQFYNVSGAPITIQMADGVYNGNLDAGSAPLGTSLVVIQGNAANPAAVRVVVVGLNCFTATGNGNILVRHLSLNSTTSAGNGGAGLGCQYGGHISFTNVIFEACTFSHIFASFNSTIEAAGNYQIIGNAPTHFAASSGASIVASGSQSIAAVTVTITGTINFSNTFCYSSGGAFLYAPLNTFTGGTVTGVRYITSLNSIIDTQGRGANYFPGNAVGQIYSGGQYN